jgi:glycosyltransferase involved in cell wall biosynthesis
MFIETPLESDHQVQRIGSNPYFLFVGRLQPHKGAERRVRFLGEIRHEELYPVVRRARLVVLPSLSDNLPNAMLEAMALGRPVIGTIGTSFDEVIEDGVSGFLVRPGDSAALADTIVAAWRRTDLDEIGQRASDAVARFAPESSVAAAEAYLEGIVASA